MSHNPPPDQVISNLPVWRSVCFAYASLLGNLRHLPAALAAPLLLSLALGLFFLNHSLEAMQNPETGNQFLSFVVGLATYIPFIIFCVAWYRLLLLGPEKATPAFLPAWRVRHWKVLSYTIALMLMFIAATSILIAVTLILIAAFVGLNSGAAGPASTMGGPMVLAVFGGMLVIIWVALRFCFIFPALSVDEDYGLVHAWRHSKGQGVRLLAASILTTLPLLPLGLLLNQLLAISTGASDSLNPGEVQNLEEVLQSDDVRQYFLSITILGSLLNYLWLALMVGLIVFAFRTCSGWVAELPGSGPFKGPADRRHRRQVGVATPSGSARGISPDRLFFALTARYRNRQETGPTGT